MFFFLISDEEAEIDFQKVELLESIKYLKKVCGKISSAFTAVNDAPSTWFTDEQIKTFSKLTEASRWLNEWRVASFFKAEKFKVCEVYEFVNTRIKQKDTQSFYV